MKKGKKTRVQKSNVLLYFNDAMEKVNIYITENAFNTLEIGW